jgi:tRNA pseudouridine38-40 synthase
MIEAAPLLEGTHDFSSFAAAAEDDREQPAVRTVFSSRLEAEGDLWLYRVRGTGFLRHMVRNIVGTLLEVGRGCRAREDIPALLAARDRKLAGPTAPARGLFLVAVEY